MLVVGTPPRCAILHQRARYYEEDVTPGATLVLRLHLELGVLRWIAAGVGRRRQGHRHHQPAWNSALTMDWFPNDVTVPQ
jgi:hypothetical protein